MRLFTAFVSVALVADAALAGSWFSKSAYNKWHETELERWLSDHDIPYPSPADRALLEKTIGDNWDNYVAAPYRNWDTPQLTAFLQQKGVDAKDSAAANKDSLVSQVKGLWYETDEKASEAYSSVKDWILDSWTESQLKAFCDAHGIPVPQPRKRDSVLSKARASYDTVAQKLGETASWPGNWLYATWTESDLKEWLDTHGIPVPQPSTRDKLIASVRRNSRLAYLKSQEQLTSATNSAQAAYESLTDFVIDSWTESQLKEFADKNGIHVPQGTKVNELRALIRKHKADFKGDNVAGKAGSVIGAATSNVAQATDSASMAAQDAFNQAINAWSDTRLKSFLDARGVPVPQASKADELRALVRKHAHKAANGYSIWTFDDYTVDNLKQYLKAHGDAAAKEASAKTGATRDELVNSAQSAYASVSSVGGNNYASATNYLAKATDSAKGTAFDTWSESDLKSYLDSYGVQVPQGSTVNQLRAYARKQSTYWRYGTNSPASTAYAKLSQSVLGTWDWILSNFGAGKRVVEKTAADGKKHVKEEL